jgi:hypothetical protein
MTKHYSEADLLETYYMEPEEATAIVAHVNECGECQERYRQLARKLRETASCPTEKPATFWIRQRMMIMRAVDHAREQPQSTSRTLRIAAAATLAFILGGAVVYKSLEPSLEKPPVIVQQQTAAPVTHSDDLQIPRDPWQSEDLKDFGTVVQWESWMAEAKTSEKASSL